jgi:hypothetical protein
METTLKSHPSWTVTLDEVSANVFRLDAVHPSGAKLQLAGTDPDALLERANDSAGKIEKEIECKNQSSREFGPSKRPEADTYSLCGYEVRDRHNAIDHLLTKAPKIGVMSGLATIQPEPKSKCINPLEDVATLCSAFDCVPFL